ncbi:hypothetical protein ACTMTI_32530 [Nonomuraea sp. H19]|uniref:hypothetical protein n=1 Tax=Nonomuraea sp. H19 TaxID=3452206 RepID=UPI003F8C0B52
MTGELPAFGAAGRELLGRRMGPCAGRADDPGGARGLVRAIEEAAPADAVA